LSKASRSALSQLPDRLPLLTVLMPAWNEEENLAANVPLLTHKLDELAVDYELLIVDDGSRDGTPRLADDLAARMPRVRAIHHARNQGIGRALYTGFRHARGRWTIFVPADLALELDEIEKYLRASGVLPSGGQEAPTPAPSAGSGQALPRQARGGGRRSAPLPPPGGLDGGDRGGAGESLVVVGLRSDRRGTSLARRLVSWANIALVRTLFWMPVHQFQYICLWPTRLLQGISIDYPDSAFLQAEVLIKARDLGYRFSEIEIAYVPRTRGQANGARTRLVLKSAADMLHFWVRWLFRRRSSDGRRDWQVEPPVVQLGTQL
jgi:glycosyltransferase involved in cell wall biosynthesis